MQARMITSTATTITADNCMVLIQCNCDLENDSVPKGRSSGCEDDLEGPILHFIRVGTRWTIYQELKLLTKFDVIAKSIVNYGY